jgi:hypothetical protein
MRFHIKSTSGRCCPRVWTVTIYLHVISLSRTASKRCCPGVWTVADCMHIISLSRISSGRCCPRVRTDASCLLNPCLQRKTGIFSNSEERLDVLPWLPECNLELFRSFSTLMGVRTHPYAVQTETKDPTCSELKSTQNLLGTLK